MKRVEPKNGSLLFEEMEEVQEFSFGSLGITAVSVTTLLIVLSQFLF